MARSGRGGLVALGCFIEAIRDAGYRGPGAALAELIDNSWEAGATTVNVALSRAGADLTVAVQDDGHGMPPSVLRVALQFGGTTRFGSRAGLGRYGMGLPAASLSQAQRVDVYSWRSRQAWWTFLDLQAVRLEKMRAVPQPQRRQPTRPPMPMAASGTIVIWSNCDRLALLDDTELDRVLRAELGRVFREYLWSGRTLVLNDTPVSPVDPLHLRPGTNVVGAEPYGPPLEYAVQVRDRTGALRSSPVTVRFVELPVAQWHSLTNEEKRRWGISKRAGVSVLRAGREIDSGWLFMGGKRKENYDDWWRCEVCFQPELDELFGVSHTKQGVRPTAALQRILSPDIERIAHDLNRRVRSAFLRLKSGDRARPALQRARQRDPLLEPLWGTRPQRTSLRGERTGVVDGLSYRLQYVDLEHECFFEPRLRRGEIIVRLNRQHPFCDECTDHRNGDKGTPHVLELVLLAAARAEVRRPPQERRMLEKFRQRWSHALMAFLS